MRAPVQPLGSVGVGAGDEVADPGLELGARGLGEGGAQLVAAFGIPGTWGAAQGLMGEQVQQRREPARAASTADAQGLELSAGPLDAAAGGRAGQDLHEDILTGAECEAGGEKRP
ncbi:hypothetical protein ACFQZC_08495 [Streptacidiphilus monticola]